MRAGRPCDRQPDPPGEPVPTRAGSFVWGGYADPHFGHLVAEGLQRLVLSLPRYPDARYLFIAGPGTELADMPAYFFDLCRWYGLDRSQIELVTRPMKAGTLRVAPQAEHFKGPAPEPHVLELLARTASRNGLVPIASDLLYVGRDGMARSGKGGHAGEGYLVDRLKRLGVSVLDPARTSLEDQLARYAGARRIVFAEGSAIHGRQLLGRLPQTVVIFPRREGQRTAEQAIAARCDHCDYVPVAPMAASVARADRRGETALPALQSAISFYDLDTLFVAFHALGVDLSSVWDPAVYQEAVRDDAAGWMSHHKWRPALRNTFDSPAAFLHTVPQVFARQGLADLLPSGQGG